MIRNSSLFICWFKGYWSSLGKLLGYYWLLQTLPLETNNDLGVLNEGSGVSWYINWGESVVALQFARWPPAFPSNIRQLVTWINVVNFSHDVLIKTKSTPYCKLSGLWFFYSIKIRCLGVTFWGVIGVTIFIFIVACVQTLQCTRITGHVASQTPKHSLLTIAAHISP